MPGGFPHKPPSDAKIRFQSFFRLIIVQPLLCASVVSESEKVPTFVSGSPPAGPYAYSRSLSS
jgi:hypothetical protein